MRGGASVRWTVKEAWATPTGTDDELTGDELTAAATGGCAAARASVDGTFGCDVTGCAEGGSETMPVLDGPSPVTCPSRLASRTA